MVSITTAQSMALAYPEAVEQPHFEKISFRVKGKIFLTLSKGSATVKLSEVDQSVFCGYDNEIFYPATGSWGKQGWTIINLKKVKKSMFTDALNLSYRQVAPSLS